MGLTGSAPPWPRGSGQVSLARQLPHLNSERENGASSRGSGEGQGVDAGMGDTPVGTVPSPAALAGWAAGTLQDEASQRGGLGRPHGRYQVSRPWASDRGPLREGSE